MVVFYIMSGGFFPTDVPVRNTNVILLPMFGIMKA